MLSVLPVIIPVFALILAGWCARRLGVLGPAATSELNRFVVYLALPALLFDIIANASWAQLWQPGFIAAFGIGSGIVFIATLTLRKRGRRPLADVAIDGLNAAYANTGFMGFPLALAVMGPGAQPMTLVAVIITVCGVFALALVLVEIGLQTETHPGRMAAKVALALARNPLLIAPLLGALFPTFGLHLPGPAASVLKLLGGAASPCALIALGLFLAEKREGARPATGQTALLVGLKLLVHPLATWILAAWVLHLPPASTRLAVLLAALPTGTGPFMIAEFYRREARLTSSVILFSTMASLVTITLYLMASA